MTSVPLIRSRCFFHTNREAAARCPECGRFFCRECVTEHMDRVLCRICLEKSAEKTSGKRNLLAGLLPLFQLASGIVMTGIFFYYLGQILLSIPSSFHEGTVWNQDWWQ